MSEQGTSIKEYIIWLRKNYHYGSEIQFNKHYSKITTYILRGFEKSSRWVALGARLQLISDTYYSKTGYPLFMGEIKLPVLQIKSAQSFIEKTYRRNVLENPNWPDAPEKGWLTPENWFREVHDIVRTMFIVKYIDGVQYLTEEINSACGGECAIDYEAREEGYYAVHINYSEVLELPTSGIDTKSEVITIEIQVTTQLQEVIRALLHKYYEENRLRGENEKRVWQWNYLSDEFSVNYMGHILHYLEGMIVDIRNPKGGSNGSKIS